MPVERSPERPESAAGVEMENQREQAIPLRQPESGTNVNATHVVRLPPFWKNNPRLWFAQVEAVFAINRITSDESKFRYVTVHLDQNVLP